MTKVALTPSKPSRRQRAATTVDRALRGGVLGAAVAAVAWVLAGAVTGLAFLVLVLATIAAAAYTVMRENANLTIWLAIGAGWAVVLIERWAVQSHGGLWVAAAAWLGVVIGARRAGISKWSLPLLAYPVLLGAIALAAGQDLVTPWGTSWLWLAAILGPVVGARTLLNPRPSETAPKGR